VTRRCGNCTLCCKLTPVVELHKRGGQRCQHQRMGKGCAIYAKRPLPCRAWDCRWLNGDDTQDQRRPDFSHCVIDMMPDYVTAMADEGGEAFAVGVVQIWVDPRHRDAWRAPEIIAFIERRGREGFGAIIRYNEVDATVVFPPSLTGAGWVEHSGPGMREHAHHQTDIAEVLTRITGEPYGVHDRSLEALGKL
jgi:hypothetical protein